jgi:hypothetical protein
MEMEKKMFFFVSFLFCRLIASPFHLNSVKGNEKEGRRVDPFIFQK